MEIRMGSDLSLDLRYFASKAVQQARDVPASDVDACIRRLEEERGKIEMFRRELPLCARLLAEGEEIYSLFRSFVLVPFLFGGGFFMRRCCGVCAVIDVMKAEAGTKTKNDRKATEEDGAAGDKSKWMSTAQLWTGDSGREDAASEVRFDASAAWSICEILGASVA